MHRMKALKIVPKYDYLLLLQQAEQKSYFCQDNNSFGESEAKVFCRMLGWPIGKALAKSQAAGNTQDLEGHLFSAADCQGATPNLLFYCLSLLSAARDR